MNNNREDLIKAAQLLIENCDDRNSCSECPFCIDPEDDSCILDTGIPVSWDLQSKKMEDPTTVKNNDKMVKEFTFEKQGDSIPKITIRGKVLHVVTFVCNWITSNSNNTGIDIITVSGYFNTKNHMSSFIINFKTGDLIEL